MQHKFCSVHLIGRGWRTWKMNPVTPTYLRHWWSVVRSGGANNQFIAGHFTNLSIWAFAPWANGLLAVAEQDEYFLIISSSPLKYMDKKFFYFRFSPWRLTNLSQDQTSIPMLNLLKHLPERNITRARATILIPATWEDEQMVEFWYQWAE